MLLGLHHLDVRLIFRVIAMSNIKALLSFLLEQNSPSGKYVLYWDCDGVLADFEAAINSNSSFLEQDAKLAQMAKDIFGKEVNREELKPMLAGFHREPQLKALKRLFNVVQDKLYDYAKREGFFLNLKPMPGAKRMFETANSMVSEKPKILSAPVDSLFCEPEKRQWVARHFGMPDEDVIIEHDKEIYAAPNHILIDDRKNNISKWLAAGGIGILHTSPDDTIKQLEEILLND